MTMIPTTDSYAETFGSLAAEKPNSFSKGFRRGFEEGFFGALLPAFAGSRRAMPSVAPVKTKDVKLHRSIYIKVTNVRKRPS